MFVWRFHLTDSGEWMWICVYVRENEREREGERDFYVVYIVHCGSVMRLVSLPLQMFA